MHTDPTDLQAILDRAVDDGALPGAALVITDRDGPVFEGAAGVLQHDGAPVGPDTMFRMASTTKALTSVAVLQLVEQGRLGLEDDVSSLLPEVAALKVLDGFDGDVPVLRAPVRAPVVRELLNHTGGMGYFFTNPDLARFHEVTGTPHVLTGQRASLDRAPLVADPGTAWEYGPHTDWLGLIVERLSGQGLDRYFDEHILGPLGMKDVTFAPTDEQLARTMPVHARTPDGGLLATAIALPPTPDWWAGGHGLYGTVASYGRFIRALLRGGELDGNRILKEESVDLAFSDDLAGVVMPLELTLPSAVPAFTNEVPAPPFAEGWGLGFHLTLEDVPGMRRAGSGDWAGLFNLYYWIDRASGIGGMLATQVLPFFDAAIVELFGSIELETYKRRPPPRSRPRSDLRQTRPRSYGAAPFRPEVTDHR